MNGYRCCRGYYPRPEYPGSVVYPVFRCPYCFRQLEPNGYMDYNMGMWQNMPNWGYADNTYANISPVEYGYNNIYPAYDNTYANVGPEQYDNVSPQYNNLGYINPEEYIHSPWENNRMYTPNDNPPPLPHPYE